MITSVKALVERFNPTTRQAMEGAAGLCLSRSHYEIEIEHYLEKILELHSTDLAAILSRFQVDANRLNAELQSGLQNLRSGNTRGPVFSPTLAKMFTSAWTIATLHFHASEIRTGHTLLALLSEEDLVRILGEVSRELSKISFDVLLKEFDTITASSTEAGPAQPALGKANDDGHLTAKTAFLDRYTVDLTKEAREGRIEIIVGRDQEIRQVIDILMRRRQNNPILTGEAGVGKTAVVEGLARRIVEKDVPASLENVRLLNLDLALLQAGASVKGEFENRLKGLLAEVKSSPIPIVLFIDEAHTMVGAGDISGQNDAANILKPALARGELRTIAATTWSEYKRYFEKDAALTRRFQVVKVEEPSERVCEAMLRSIVPSLEKHHSTRILDEAIGAAVRLSHRYLPGRQLPDKAVSVLDTACARVALSQNTAPAPVEALRRRISLLQDHLQILVREQSTGIHHEESIREKEEDIRVTTAKLAALEESWRQELEVIQNMDRLYRQLEQKDQVEETVRHQALGDLDAHRAKLKALQIDIPLTHAAVDVQTVATVVSEWTGVPLGKMVDDELTKILHLKETLKQRIIGQDHALAAIAQRIWTSRANMEDPSKPIGVFLFAGPSGVGKTETALALADLLYGGESHLITINMSEFQETHSVSTLKGAPPGYVGYGEGGVLTDAVRRQPYSVVLLDEVEKAHPDVLELFFQVFDKGYLEDGSGRSIDFRNTLILLTTNAASDLIAKLCADPETAPLPEEMVAALRPELNRVFKPAFLGRTLIVPYYPVKDHVLTTIIQLKLDKIGNRLTSNHRVHFAYDQSLVDLIRHRCTEVESGARNVDHILSNTLLPEISRTLLERLSEGDSLEQIFVSASEQGELIYEWNEPLHTHPSEAYLPA